MSRVVLNCREKGTPHVKTFVDACDYFHGNARKNVWLKKVPDGMIEISGHRPIERA